MGTQMVGHGAETAVGCDVFNRVVVGVDGSEEVRQAARLVASDGSLELP